MNINPIHFMREVLVTYHFDATPVPSMQFSCDNPSYENPVYERVPDDSQAQVRELYYRLGGIRKETETVGSTVVIPYRSWMDQILQRFDG